MDQEGDQGGLEDEEHEERSEGEGMGMCSKRLNTYSKAILIC